MDLENSLIVVASFSNSSHFMDSKLLCIRTLESRCEHLDSDSSSLNFRRSISSSRSSSCGYNQEIILFFFGDRRNRQTNESYKSIAVHSIMREKTRKNVESELHAEKLLHMYQCQAKEKTQPVSVSRILVKIDFKCQIHAEVTKQTAQSKLFISTVNQKWTTTSPFEGDVKREIKQATHANALPHRNASYACSRFIPRSKIPEKRSTQSCKKYSYLRV